MRLHTSHGKQFPHQQPNVVAVSGLHTLTILRSIVLFAFIALSGTALAQDWQVSITLHEAFSITNNSVLGDDSIYAKMRLSPSGPGAGEDVRCNTKRLSDTYNRHVFPEWVCTGTVSDSSGDSPLINITLELWNYLIVTSSRFDRHFDINPDFVQRDINMVLDPRNHDFAITGLPEWTTARCAEGKIRLEGFGGGDRGRVEFSVSASIPGAIDGDSDSDGLLDSWEICGTEGVDLPAMGADPYIKDLFVEADWMVDDDAIAPTDHSHEPPLQSLANAWHEFKLAPVTNPPQGITPTHPGIHLHVDVGDLYEDFAAGTLNIGDCTPGQDFDLNGNGTCESIDLDMDGRPDIGDFGGGGRIPGQEDTVMVGCLDTEEIGTIQRFNFDMARRGVFRYALFAHRYRDATNFSSGVACSVDLFTITLGTLFNGVSGNSGLPVIGSVDENTGTFLHELGHTLSLSHGGNEHKNYKPNYLSLMNYYFQFPGLGYDLDGDGLQDDLAGIDFNYDGAPDSQRFSYSNDRSRISIDESGLDETLGVQDTSAPGIWARAITRVGPSPVFNNAGRCILACDMIPVCRSNCLLSVLANGPIDWDRDGSAISPSESELANPPFPAGIKLDLNRDGAQDTLNSFFDYEVLQNGGLRPRSTAAIVGPGIEVPLAETHRRETLSIVPVADQATLMANCDRGFDGIDFEGFPPGTIISNQYDSVAQFLVDTLRTPTIIGATISTHSPTQNLANFFPNIPAPLVIDFPKPRRMVGLYLGRATTGDPTDSAVLRAFDVDGYPMGEIDRLLLAPKDGINTFLGIGAIFPGRLISRVELEYQGPGVSAEGVQIDDLLLCTTKTEDPNPVTIPPVPDYGDINVKAKFQAWLITEDPNGQNEMNLIATPIQDPFLNVDGTLVEHDVEIDKQQAEILNLSTPQSIPGAAFVHWEAIAGIGGATVFFNEGKNALSLPLLRTTTFSAIYAPDGDGDGIPDLQVGESVDNCPMHANPGQEDSDTDNVGNTCDNCQLLANPDQRDTNGDGYGNRCDADFNGDLTVNLSDFSAFRSKFGTVDPDADFNGDGTVNLSDFSIFRSSFGKAPGPSCCGL